MYCPHAGCHPELVEGSHVKLSADLGDDEATEIPAEFKHLINAIYTGEISEGVIHTPSALNMAGDFMESVDQGIKQAGFDYATPDTQLFESLQKSVFRFSAAKSWQINKDLSGLLYDGDRLRSQSEFENLARKQLDVYLGQYARIERSSALVNSEMAAKVQRFKEDKDILPYWEFRTSGADSVCPICQPYNGMVRSADDHVWSYATPQLHYGCYCTIVQVPATHATVTPSEELPDPELIPKVFRTDIAGKMQAFPPDHPYYEKDNKKSINKWVNKNLPK